MMEKRLFQCQNRSSYDLFIENEFVALIKNEEFRSNCSLFELGYDYIGERNGDEHLER